MQLLQKWCFSFSFYKLIGKLKMFDLIFNIALRENLRVVCFVKFRNAILERVWWLCCMKAKNDLLKKYAQKLKL